MHEKNSFFIDPFTDFGFKHLFGRKESKSLLIDLLNAILKPERKIIEIEYLPTEQIGFTEFDRKAVFDIHCRDEDGNMFIIEMQQLWQTYFKARSLFYSMFPISRQSKKGEWNFDLKRTFTICFMDFTFDDSDQMLRRVKLVDVQTNEVFSDLLSFLYVEMPKFNKEEHELITREDLWLYVLNKLTTLREIPLFLSEDPVFKRFFMDAEQAKLSLEELHMYFLSRKAKWDEYAIMETALIRGQTEGKEAGKAMGKIEGKIEGKAEGKAEATEERNTTFVTRLLQNTNHSPEEIANLVGVHLDFVLQVQENLL